MIDRAYCEMMARYNVWQNSQLNDALSKLDHDSLTRGAFFGSILGTANHLLWGDHIWMSRFDGGSVPDPGIPESTDICATQADWSAERSRIDRRITLWAQGLQASDLQGDLTWHSSSVNREVVRPVAMCAVHMFNHQTHHRGQIHAMLTATGRSAPVSDLVSMPEDA